MDLLHDLSQATIGDISEKRNSESIGYTQDIIWNFTKKTIGLLHEGGNNMAFANAINSLELSDLVNGTPSSKQNDANKHGYNLVQSYLKETYKDLDSYPFTGTRDLISLLQWLVTQHQKSDIITNARSLLTRIFPRLTQADQLRGQHENIIAKFDLMFLVANGHDDDWRLKCSQWKLNFANSVAELSPQHIDILGQIEEIFETQIDIIDSTANEDEREAAKKAIKDAWNNTYKQLKLRWKNSLFVDKPKEVKQSIVATNTQKRKQPSNIKTSSPPEKRGKANHQGKQDICTMCTLKGREKNKHKTEQCRTFNYKLFKNTLESIVELTPEEKSAAWLKSKEDKNKSNYLVAYNALQSLESKDNSQITFLIDGGANVNIVRDKTLFTHTSNISLKLNSLGGTHTAELGGTVEVYIQSHDGKPILLRFDAIYISASTNEEVNIISTSQLVQKSLACHCFGFCKNMCGNISPTITDSLIVTTTSGDTIRLQTTSINGTSRLEAQRSGPEDCQVVDISSRQVTDDLLQKQQLTEENYDSEDENEIYQALEYTKDQLDEELKVFTATLLPEIVIPEETNIENISKNPGEETREKMLQKRQLSEAPQNQRSKKSEINPENASSEEESLFAKRMRYIDQAQEIHQRCGHMNSQKILESIGKCLAIPEYEQISKPVLQELKNLNCTACALTRNHLLRHPKSASKQRSQTFGQCIKVDVAYAPNRFKSEHEKKIQANIPFSKGDEKLPATSIEDHIARTGFGAPYALILVDEFSRWTTVLPLRTLREDEFIHAFVLFRDELTKMLHKYQKNNARREDGTAQHATNKSKFDLFTFDTRIQEVLTDKQTGMFKSEKFRNFMQTFWARLPNSNEEPFYTETVLQFVPVAEHAYNGIAERKIRTLKEKAMVSLITAFGDKNPADLDSFVYTYWFWAVKHAATTSNVMSVTVNGKAEVSPYTHVTGKIFPMSQMYPFFAKAAAPTQNKHEQSFEKRLRSTRVRKPTERALHAAQNKSAKTLPYINKEKVRYLYTDLTGHKIQPVVLNEDAWKINEHALTYFQNMDHMKNIVIKTQVAIDARSFINMNPKNKPSPEQLNKFANYIALLYENGEKRTTDMEDLETFLGFEIPRSLSLPEPTKKGTGQHRGQKPGVDASNDVQNDEEESTTCSEVYYCPSVESDEIDIIKHNNIDVLFPNQGETNNNITKYSAYAINCESNSFNIHEEDENFITPLSTANSNHASAPLWAYAVSRINSETGEQIKKRSLSECSEDEIKTAIKNEIDGIKEKDVLQHIPSEQWRSMWPKGKAPKTLDTRVVLAVKENGDIKARLVAKGFRQRPGENFFQTFSPVVDRTSVHTIINIAAIKGLPLYSLDISQAFLQAPIDEDVYIKYDGEIFKLKKALYGTKQASRMWNKEITKALKSYGMQQSRTDPCVFVQFEQSKPQVFVCVSTDDLLVASQKEHWQNLAAYLSHDYQGRFKTSQLNIDEECTSFNGIEIKRENAHRYSINLNTYTNQLLLEYAKAYTNMAPKADIPAYGKQVYDKFTPEELKKCNAKEIKEYQSIVGQITWLSTNTRPDLVHFTASASRAAKDPLKGQLKILRRIIGYLKHTPSSSITFDGNGIDEIRIEAFTDAGESSTAFSANLPPSNQSHSKHTSGYVISMGSGALSWKSKLQPRVSDSICKGEYMAAELCLHEVKFIRDLLSDVGFPQTHTIMFIDNQASINLMLNNTSLKKHDRTTIHVLQESVDERIFIPIYIPSKLNVADMFTKANAAKSGGQDKSLMALINGSQLSAVDYRKHIESIVNDNYIKINKIPEFPSAEKLLKHVSLAHKVREKIEENDSRFPSKH